MSIVIKTTGYITTLLDNEQFNPSCLDVSRLNEGILTFSSGLDVFDMSLGTASIQQIGKFEQNLPSSSASITAMLSLSTVDSTRAILVAIHSFNQDYNPDKNNGVWLMFPGVLEKTNNSWIKVFPKNTEKPIFITSLVQNGNLFYASDAAGYNIWWFDLKGGSDYLAGLGKKSYPKYYYSGVDSNTVQNIPEFNQGGKGPGVSSLLLIQLNGEVHIVFTNYGSGLSAIGQISSDGKSFVETPIAFNKKMFQYTYTGTTYSNDGFMYVGVGINLSSGTAGSSIIKTKLGSSNVTFIKDSRIGLVTDLKYTQNGLLFITLGSSLTERRGRIMTYRED